MEKKFKVQPLRGVEIHNAKSVGTRTVNLLMGEHSGEYVRGDIMDANAVVQAIDEVRGGIDTGHDTLKKLSEEVKTNATVVNGTITLANKIKGDLETEKNDREAQYNDFETKFNAECNTRENNDKALEKKIDANKASIDVINGDSNTDGSFKKAIADVVGAAPEAYDTLKEIADKLKDNDDLHATINDAIASKATNEALTNEINRATAKENEINTALEEEVNRATDKESEIETALTDLSDVAIKGDGHMYTLLAKGDEGQFVGYRRAFYIYENKHDIWRMGIANYNYETNDISDVIDNLLLDSSHIFLGHDAYMNSDGLLIRDNDITLLKTNPDTQKQERSKAVFVPEDSPLIVDNKIVDSYIPSTVALKSDLTGVVKVGNDGKISADLLPEMNTTVNIESLDVFKLENGLSTDVVYVGSGRASDKNLPIMGIQTYQSSQSGDPESINNQNLLVVKSYSDGAGTRPLISESTSQSDSTEYNETSVTAAFSPHGTHFAKQVQIGNGQKKITIDGDADSYIKLYGSDNAGGIQLDYVGGGSFAYNGVGVYITDGSLAPINYKNGIAKLNSKGYINDLIEPAEMTDYGVKSVSAIKSIDSSSTSATVDLINAFNELLAYAKGLEAALLDANIITGHVVSE